MLAQLRDEVRGFGHFTLIRTRASSGVICGPESDSALNVNAAEAVEPVSWWNAPQPYEIFSGASSEVEAEGSRR